MRICKCLIAILLIITLIPVHAFASQNIDAPENIVYYDDGSYLVINTTISDARVGFTRNAVREYTYYASNGDTKWVATLKATFTYDGTSCTCASSSLFVNILDDAWYIVSKEEGKSGNTATGELTMGYKFLGITTTKKTVSMRITCDKDGNLS